MSIRTRILLAIALPAITLLIAFSVIVYVQVHASRMADLDLALGARAAALAAAVELEDDGWETHLTGELVAGLDGFEVRVPGTDRILAHGGTVAPNHRRWQGTLPVRTDHPRDASTVDVIVAQSTEVVDGQLRGLMLILLATGVTLAGIALAIGSALSRRIVDPIRDMAARAEAITTPSADPALVPSGSGDELDRLATTLNQTFARLHAAFSRQARFTADASHELRTPLAVIRTEAEVALHQERSPAIYREALMGVVEGATRMQEVVEGLLLLARADEGAEPERQPVDLLELVEDVVGLLPARIPPVAVEGSPLTVRADAGHLAIAVRNLVDNAMRHAPDGPIRVAVSREGNQARIVVVDRGEGIAAEVLPHLFDRFFRADAARDRDRGGAGLGLSIVKAIVDAHGGVVAVQSAEGQGTTFTVSLPIAAR